MAIKRLKILEADLAANTRQEMENPVALASSSGFAGTAYKATSAGRAGTASTTSTAP